MTCQIMNAQYLTENRRHSWLYNLIFSNRKFCYRAETQLLDENKEPVKKYVGHSCDYKINDEVANVCEREITKNKIGKSCSPVKTSYIICSQYCNNKIYEE